MAQQTQSYENHARYVTGYHRIGVPLMAFPAAYFVAQAFKNFTPDTVALALFAVGASIVGFYTRFFANGNQDRIIRLEETLRLERILPPDLKPLAGRLTPGQLVALRFASDDEVAGLVRRIVAGELTSAKAIKQAIKQWRPDHMRV